MLAARTAGSGTWAREARTPPRMTVSSPGMTKPRKRAVSPAESRKTAATTQKAGIERKALSSRSSIALYPALRGPDLPAMVGGMAFLHRNKRAAAEGGDAASRLERRFDDRAVRERLDDLRPERQGNIHRRGPLERHVEAGPEGASGRRWTLRLHH